MAGLETNIQDGVLVVHFPDSELMDEDENRQIGAELKELATQSGGKMLISFRGVEFVTSSMLGQLVMLNKRCLAENVMLKICDVGPDLRMIFRIVRLDTLVEVCGDELAALNAFKTGQVVADAQGELGSPDVHRTQAEVGDPAAQFALARCYEEGHGIEQSFPAALQWFEKAGEQGHAGAQHALGTYHAYGMQVTQDYGKAMDWFQKAAEQGHANSQYMLGVSYAHGLAGTQDFELAAQWFQRAADAGDVEAQVNLAEAHLEGRGVEQDQAKALHWLHTAATRGSADAQTNLAWFYLNGEGVVEDRDEALRLYGLAAAQGHEAAREALNNLGDE